MRSRDGAIRAAMRGLSDKLWDWKHAAANKAYLGLLMRTRANQHMVFHRLEWEMELEVRRRT